MSTQAEILFHSSPVFAGQVGIVDRQNGVIHGVSTITGDCVAEGHDLAVDAETLKQLHSLARSRPQIPCNIDHSTGVENTCGWLQDFRLDGNKIRADLHLLDSHPRREQILDLAEKMSSCLGLSCAFKGQGVTQKNGKKAARAEKLLSVDLVTRPATGDGLFSARDTHSVDTQNNSRTTNTMPEQTSSQTAEPTIAELKALIESQNARIDQLTQITEQVVGHINQDTEQQGEEPTLADLANATDEQLDAAGFDVQAVRAAVQQAVESGELVAEGGEQAQANGSERNIDSSTNDAALAGAASGAGGVAMAAVAKEIIQLKAELKARDQREIQLAEAEQQLSIEQKFAAIAEKNKKLVEFAEKLTAENEALRISGRTGTKPVSSSIQLEERVALEADGRVEKFEAIVDKEYNRLIKLGGITDIKARSQSIDFGIKRHPESYASYRKRGTPELQFSAK
jgi:hypothetical protein